MPSWPAELPAPSAPPEDARQTADEILSRPEYREPEPSLVERVLDAVGDFLGEAIATLAGSGPGGAVASLVVAGLVVVAVWFLLRSLGAGRRPGHSGAEPLVQGTTAPDDPAIWLAEASRLVTAGDHRSAMRCRYQAMVARLVRDGAVDDVPGRTPRELAAELVVLAPDLAGHVGAVTTAFEQAWYGGGAVTAAQYERFAAAVAVIEELQRSPRPRLSQGAPA